MFAFKAISTTLLLAFAVTANAGPEAAKKDLERLEGQWSMVFGERDGQPLPDPFFKGSKRVAKSGETTVTIGDKLFMKAKYTIDPSKKPKWINYELLEGPNKGKTQLGIYETDADQVKFCFSAPGADRPTDFTTKPGSGRTLSTWKRDKSKDGDKK
jgi:uncharacterized protein (TIGR03067 family)